MNQPTGSGFTRPKALDDGSLNPQQRADLLSNYAGAIFGKPSSQWNDEDKRAVREQIDAVLAQEGFRG